MTFVGANLVMRVPRGLSPIPHRNHQIALDTLRTGRCWWQVACGDPIRPVRKHFDSAFLVNKPGQRATHPVSAGLTEMDARSPRLRRRLEIESRQVREIASEIIAKLVALLAILFHDVDPLLLGGNG